MDSATIYALATAPGVAGIAIIRVSGPDAGKALEAMTGERVAPRFAKRVKITNPKTSEPIDDGLVLWFPGPASFTGEDVCELHVHGGHAVVQGVLEGLGGVSGLRLAEAGEFTRRAFENGKMDLTAAEGLADLVAAETAAQRKQALRQLDGELGRIYETWRERLLAALAHREANIDFSDEDLPDGIDSAANAELADIEQEIGAHLADNRRGERLRSGLLIAIIGPPNAGKSSLLNQLARRDAAIVSEVAGTTRDVIEVHLDLGGFPVIVADTAGLREGGEAIEAEGVRRAHAKAENADLRLAVFDGATWPDTDPMTAALVDDDTVVVVSKADLGVLAVPLEVGGQKALAISAQTGDGIDDLLAAIDGRVHGMINAPAAPALTRLRHRDALEECHAALGRFLGATERDKTPELAAEDLRLAVRALGRITGRVDVDDVLDVIFRDFCIGK
ncbi:MAG: tRNA uridine-5-carboxymethylaminomethyl(34) synthesis GTPase MnmE [Rhodospirillales bacterium]